MKVVGQTSDAVDVKRVALLTGVLKHVGARSAASAEGIKGFSAHQRAAPLGDDDGRAEMVEPEMLRHGRRLAGKKGATAPYLVLEPTPYVSATRGVIDP